MKLLIKYKLGLALLAVTSLNVTAAQPAVPLVDVAKAMLKTQPGDTIFIADGTYSDVSLRWRAPGHKLTVCAENPGKVIITGKSSLRIGGDSLCINGLDFIKAHPEKGNVVDFRLSSAELANNCRLTNCVIDNCNPARRDITSSYIVLHGRNNTVDHCSLTGKLSIGVTLLVNLNDSRSLNNGHRVEYNYFGYRPVYGSNGAETMRIGTSQQAYETSNTTVANNYFEKCNGEVEIISVKSSGNHIVANTFDQCEGVVALRHGRNNEVTGNLFCGQNVMNTGGVRIVDAGHTVSQNIFSRLAGKRFYSALAVMNSVPNSLPNRYVRVSDVSIVDNIFVDCSNIEFGTGRDMERTEAPEKVLFGRNILAYAKHDPVTFIDAAAGIELVDNKLENNPGIFESRVDALRTKTRQGAGATRTIAVRTAETVTDTIVLDPGVVIRSEPIVITRPTVLKGQNTTLRWEGTSGDNFITIADGGTLTVSGITFDGSLQRGRAVVKNAIATASTMITPYTLTVDNCNFINMPESGCCAIRGLKGTFADSVTVTNCRFADLSGNAVSLADETDDKGRYSADNIVIKDCVFEHMLGIPVNIYRGGSDESTAGPYVYIEGCKFIDCCNRERGSVLRLIGPQILNVSKCVFDKSGRGGASVRLDETTWENVTLTDCSFINSGRVISNRNVVSNTL